MSAAARILAAAAVATTLLLAPSCAEAGVPEGPRIAFTVDPVESQENQLRSASVDGTDVRSLGSARGAARAELASEFPVAWSPGGDRLAVIGFHAGSIRIYVVSAAAGGFRLVPGTAGALFPAFSPDGRTLAFTVARPEFGSEMATASAKEQEGSSIWTLDL
jgi:Tol biopolymer transport system component